MGRMIGAAEFKAKCLAILDEVQSTGEPVTVTKRGKPVAVLKPSPDHTGVPRQSAIGFLKSARYRFDGDPEAPAGNPKDWDALQ